MKIGIITEFHRNTVNYGNNLQAYALNRYLRETFPEHSVETLCFKENKKLVVTSYICLAARGIRKIWRKLRGRQAPKAGLDKVLVGARLASFRAFQKTNIDLSPQEMTWELLQQSDYDMFIVGSDVVWAQSMATVNRIKFLDFQNRKNAIKVSYAASFGQNVIPRENRKTIGRMLRSFRAVSVRESSAVKLLHSIGIDSAVHTADPTLLLPERAWSDLERAPKVVPSGKPFVFAYLLGTDDAQKEMIDQTFRKKGLPVVYVPYASGTKEAVDIPFGDIPVEDCSPEEWLWLNHHAEYVVTDSFHGVVFATIFKRRFLVLKRNYVRDINVRLTDYMETIGQSDKALEPGQFFDLDSMEWDYVKIDQNLEKFKARSRAFLDNVCQQ